MIKLTLLSEINPTSLFNLIEQNRTDLQKWFPWVDKTTCIEDSEVFIASCNDRHWGIELNKELIGVIGIPNIAFEEKDKTCELGFWLDTNHQGKGIMKKACASLIEHIFINSDIKIINIKTKPNNERCISLINKLGFQIDYRNSPSELIYSFNLSTWLEQQWLYCKEYIPTLDPDVMIRKNEPIAYNKRLGKIYHLNEEGESILRLVADGNKNILDIVNILQNTERTMEETQLFAHKIMKFIDKCFSIELTSKLNVAA